MKTMSLLEKIIYGIVFLIFAGSIAYMAYYIGSHQSVLIPREDVQLITEWTYTDELGGTEKVETPVKVETDGRDTYVFESHLPENFPAGSVIAVLNRMDIKVEVNGRTIKDWKRSQAPTAGGVAKNSYFILPLSGGDEGSDIKITVSGEGYSGKLFDIVVGREYEVVRYLEIKNGALQFALSFSLLVCSFAIIIAGLVLMTLYKQGFKLILIALGIFAASSWMVVDSFVFQFLFRTQFIDGLMSYMTTMCITFPFVAYLNAIQEYRYRKWYIGLNCFALASLILFTSLHMSRTVNFANLLLYVDGAIGVVVVGSFIITLTDIKRGLYKSYRYVCYGFLFFMATAIVELVLINTTIERVQGGSMILGLYVLFGFAIFQQLIEIKEIQLDRDRANEEGIAKTKFLASMSHEIRTPINSILGMNEMILKESRDPDILNYAGIINDSGTLLLSIINDVLDVSKISNDMEEIVSANYDPAKMFDTAADMLRANASKKGLMVKIGKPRNLPEMLCGDEKRIAQIMINLLSNAVKYTEEGTVSFTGECFENKDEYVLCFYISDTGIGIKDEDKENIFDPFHRLDLRKNQNIQGTGLGLAIVRKLVEKMNGEINVESVYGKGTTFSVRLPQKPMEEDTIEKYNLGNSSEDDNLERIDANYIAPEAKVLEVDDNMTNQIVVKQFLKETGAQLDLASGGMEALRLCKVNKYDVILMDHMMPDPDGIETMHLIKSEEDSLNRDTPIIVLTANALVGSKAMYEAEGFDNYLSKPVESDRLRKMVRKYLPDDKVMYKPKKRAGDEAAVEKVSADTPAAPAEAPVDIPALLARFDNQQATVNLILEEVIKEGERKIPLLKDLVAGEDIKRYAVEAHGIKGVMASSCIPHLSATAKAHELAAKGDNFDYVRENIDIFVNEYEEVLDYIREYLKGQEQ